MEFIDKAIKKLEKQKGKVKEQAKKFLKDHKQDFEILGKKALEDMFADHALGDTEEAIKTQLIMKQPPDALIKGVLDSATTFQQAKKQMHNEKKRITHIWHSIGSDVSKIILPALIKIF